jgi:hypothetical protein
MEALFIKQTHRIVSQLCVHYPRCQQRLNLVLWFAACLAVSVAQSAKTADIFFTNKFVTFTNLQGRIFQQVQLLSGDWDGVIWRDDMCAGRVSYTNLSTAFLDAWDIPTNRIGVARKRAEHRAVLEARERLEVQIQAEAQRLTEGDALAWEATNAPLRAWGEQRQKESEAIDELEKQIELAKIRLHRAQAMAHDYNHANLHNSYAPRIYVKDTTRLQIQEAEARLKKMKAEFTLKYGLRK